MSSPVPQDYVRSAQLHLDNAFDLYTQMREQQYDAVFVEMAYVASRIWDSGIALLSAIMLLDGRATLGASTLRYRYLKHTLSNLHPALRLRTNWSYLASLHSFQHNLNMLELRFVDACHYSAELIASLNGLLPENLRLADEAYRWLYDVE